MEGGSEYEKLPTTNMQIHMLAGGAAGVVEHCAVYPLDNIKTKMQSINPSTRQMYRNVVSTAQAVCKSSGVLSTFRGVNVVAMGAGPAHALYFATYELSKAAISKKTYLPDTHALVAGTSATFATIVHDGFMNPIEVMKQRLQMHNSPYHNLRHCLQRTLQTEGLQALYRSYAMQLATNVPFQTIHFYVYENVRAWRNLTGTYDPMTHVIAGGAAGATAAAATTPLDVIKTVLNTQEAAVVQSNQSYTNGICQAAMTVHRHWGVRGFVRGLAPRVLYQMPSTAICWLAYESLKHLLAPLDVWDRTAPAGAVTDGKELEALGTFTKASPLGLP